MPKSKASSKPLIPVNKKAGGDCQERLVRHLEDDKMDAAAMLGTGYSRPNVISHEERHRRSWDCDIEIHQLTETLP